MAILDVSKYSNHLELFKLSSIEIETQITSFNLEFFKTRNKEAEWHTRFPTFLDSFYKYIYNKNTLPSQSQFYTYYLANNKKWFSSNSLNIEVLEGLKARLYRTYPSLIRDLHFSKLVSEKPNSYQTIYNTNLDVKEGIDLLLIMNTKNIAVNLYTKTSRAFIGREKKQHRHKVYTNINYVELPVSFSGSLKKGDFFLYGNREIKQLEKEIKNTISS